MIYIHWLFLLVYTLVIAIAMLKVLMDNRQPAKTLAWLLVLSFFANGGYRIILLLRTKHTQRETDKQT